MADRFDEGRDGLESASPGRDLWAEAEARSAHSTVPLTTVPEARGRHPGRWLAVAAAIALVAGVGVALLDDDGDPGVSAGPGQVTTSSSVPSPTYGAGTACPFTLTGEQVELEAGHVPGEVFDVDGGLGSPSTVVHGHLGAQPVEVSIPGQIVTDLIGERVEDVGLARGTAQLWLTDGFAQVRWFPGSELPCESFTVTVFGGGAASRDAAVDLADRLVLPAAATHESTTVPPDAGSVTTTSVETAATGWPVEGPWDLYSVQAHDDDASFPANLQVIFGGTTLKWGDGCNEHLGTVERVDGHTMVVRDPRVQAPRPCPNSPDAVTLEQVLGSGRPVTAQLDGAAGSIYLTLASPDGDTVVLRRTNDGRSPSGEAPFG